jgi:sporulation-control protein
MVFKKLKASLGLGGGAGVETELETADVRPGETVSGVVVVTGGDLEQSVKYLELALRARVEVETDDAEYDAEQVFHRHRVTEAFELEPGAEQRFEFALQVPIETPFNVVGGHELPKVRIGVATELEIARAMDSTDVDPLRVHALPVHEAVLDAIGRLGFGFTGADLESGKIPGAQLPFYQEVEFRGSPRFDGINQLEVTFLTSDSGTEVILEADRRGGFLSSGGDSVGRLSVANAPAGDLEARLDEAIRELGRSRGLFG